MLSNSSALCCFLSLTIISHGQYILCDFITEILGRNACEKILTENDPLREPAGSNDKRDFLCNMRNGFHTC